MHTAESFAGSTQKAIRAASRHSRPSGVVWFGSHAYAPYSSAEYFGYDFVSRDLDRGYIKLLDKRTGEEHQVVAIS